MAFFRKVVAGLVKAEIDEFVGEEGNLFFDIETGGLRLSDGQTPGGISIAGGGTGSSLKVSTIDINDTVSNEVTNVKAIRFDSEAGFDVTNLGSGVVKVGMNSTFKTWKVDGQNDLIANGLDTMEFVAGSGLVITTDPLSNPKSITFKTVDKTVTLYQDGLLEPTVGTVRWHNPRTVNINKIIARLAEAADSTVTVLVKKNSLTVQTINFSVGSVKQTTTVDIDMIVDDYLTVDITAVGNTAKGRGLSIEFTYSFE
jgi:hypothetical protein